MVSLADSGNRTREPTDRPDRLTQRGEASDAELLSAAVSNAAIFERVFERHIVDVYRYVARRVEPAVVEDLVAETFATAFDRRARYRAEYPDARPWLLGIATNLVRHHRRSECSRLRAYARACHDDAPEGIESEAVALADARTVRAELALALGKLRRGDRDALLLMAWADLSYEEIAEALEIPVGTVRSRLNRARRQLRAILRDVPAISERTSPNHSPHRPRDVV